MSARRVGGGLGTGGAEGDPTARAPDRCAESRCVRENLDTRGHGSSGHRPQKVDAASVSANGWMDGHTDVSLRTVECY